MMYKIMRKIIILFVAIACFTTGKVYNADENKSSLLIIYDVYKEYLGETNNLNTIIKMSLTTGNNIEIRTVENYTTEDLKNSKGIILLCNEDRTIEKSKVDEIYKYNEKLIWIGKNSTESSVINLDFSNEKLLIEVKDKINNKFNVKNKYSQNSYLILDKIYAFDDLNLIIEKVDYLYDNGIPFLIDAMSVYENKDFEAMKRYTEVLRYATSKGGTIILGNPFLYDKGPTESELVDKTGMAQDIFINYKVYPIGLTIDDYYLYRNDRKKYLDKTSTIIIDENEKIEVLDFDKYSIKGFDNVLLKVNIENINELSNLLSDVAIGVKPSYSMDEFIKYIDLCKEYKIEFTNPINLTSEISFGENVIKNNREELTVNNIDMRGNNFISNEELFSRELEENNDEESKVENKESFDLKNINKVIFTVTITGGVIFIILFIGALRRDKRKYYK